jgi:hypothetical protein
VLSGVSNAPEFKLSGGKQSIRQSLWDWQIRSVNRSQQLAVVVRREPVVIYPPMVTADNTTIRCAVEPTSSVLLIEGLAQHAIRIGANFCHELLARWRGAPIVRRWCHQGSATVEHCGPTWFGLWAIGPQSACFYRASLHLLPPVTGRALVIDAISAFRVDCLMACHIELVW